MLKGWRRQWQPTLVLLHGKSHGWSSLAGCSPWGREESDTTERLHFHFSLSCTGEGNGSPLQCSCLENPTDQGAWWAAVYGVAQSRTRTRLKRLSSSSRCWKLSFFVHWCWIESQRPSFGWSRKGSACQIGDVGSIPGSGRPPRRRKWQPSPVFLPGKSHGRGAWWARVRGVETEPDTAWQLNTAAAEKNSLLGLPGKGRRTDPACVPTQGALPSLTQWFRMGLLAGLGWVQGPRWSCGASLVS